jgi:predicted ATPase with chaperone activity
MSPCPCGYYGDSLRACTCSESTVTRYQKRLSGPLLDRIDIHVEVPRVESASEFASKAFTSARDPELEVGDGTPDAGEDSSGVG